MTEKQTILRDLSLSILSHLKTSKTYNCGLLSGSFGPVVFLYHAANTVDKRLTEQADYYLEKICNNLPDNISTYCGGLAGFAVGLALLADNGLIALESNIFNDIDLSIQNAFETALNQKNIDFLHGATGYMLYAISCSYVSPGMWEPYAEKYIRWILNNRVCIDREKNLYTLDFPNLKKSPKRNISLSHGLSSVIIALCRILELNPMNSTVQDLLRGFTDYLKTQLFDPDKLGSFTPCLPTDSDAPLRKSRLAWCYGDPGVAAAFHAAATALDDSALEAISYEILAVDSSRRSYEESFLVDAPVCHGIAGIAQIYSSAASRNRSLRLARDVWHLALQKSVKILRGRYTFYTYDADIDGYIIRHSLLEGIAGIGMVLLDTPQSNHFMNSILLLK